MMTGILVVDFQYEILAKYYGRTLTKYCIFNDQSIPAVIYYSARTIVRIKENGEAEWVKENSGTQKAGELLTEEDKKELMFQILKSTRYGYTL